MHPWSKEEGEGGIQGQVKGERQAGREREGGMQGERERGRQ